LLLRTLIVLYVLSHFGPAWFFSRGSEMGFLAAALLHHEGLSSPFGVPTGPTAIVAPGYPLLVAAIFYVFGIYTWTAALVLMLLHALLNTVTVYLIYRFSRAVADERTACVAAMFWAYSVPLVWMPTIFWETSFSSMLTIGGLCFALAVRPQRTLRFWFCAGGLCSLAGLMNPALLPSLLVMLIATCVRNSCRPRRWQCLVAAAVGVILVFSPWPIRNARVLHAHVLTRTTVGLELWMGNHPGSKGFLQTSLFPTYNVEELSRYRREGEIAYTSHKGLLARAFIADHPGRFLRLSGQRFLRFWTGTGTQGGSVFFALHATISTGLGLSGLVLLWRRGNRNVCFYAGILLLLLPLPYYVTHAEFRYRLVVDPPLIALSAPTLQRLLKRVQASTEEHTQVLSS
jgi:hypothetical protein